MKILYESLLWVHLHLHLTLGIGFLYNLNTSKKNLCHMALIQFLWSYNLRYYFFYFSYFFIHFSKRSIWMEIDEIWIFEDFLCLFYYSWFLCIQILCSILQHNSFWFWWNCLVSIYLYTYENTVVNTVRVFIKHVGILEVTLLYWMPPL